jgi:DNA-binding MarR family transcriptional regulator
LEPEPLGIAHVYNRRPYSNPKHIQQDLDDAVSQGWLTCVGKGIYQASPKSHRIFDQLCRGVMQVYSHLKPMPVSQLQQLDGYLHRVVEAIRKKDGLSYKPSFELDVKLGNIGGPILQRICCNFSHFLAYRDDAYVNAWMSQDVNSYVWEAFSCIYKGQAQNAREIVGRLGKYRYYDRQTYDAALRELIERGWITRVDKKYEPTEAGIKVLAHVARAMNQYFYKPWIELGEDELKALKCLMESLAQALKTVKPKYGVGYAYVNRTIGWGSVQWARDKVR